MTIIARKHTDLENILQSMEQSDYTFTMCGSRRYGYPRQDSDWDFFIGPSEVSLQDWLTGLGFTKIESHDYYDTDLIALFRHSGGIDIQVRRDPELYERCCLFLETHKHLSKFFGNHYQMRGEFWTVLLEALKEQR